MGSAGSRGISGLSVSTAEGGCLSKKKPPITGAKQQGSCVRSKDHVKFWSNESAGLAIPEQPTRFAEISATDSRLSYQISSLLSKTHAVLIAA